MLSNLMAAIQQNDTQKVAQLAMTEIINQSQLISIRGQNWSITPLQTASVYNHVACVRILIAHDAHINDVDHNGLTALYIAAKSGHIGCVSALLAHKAHVNQEAHNGTTPLHVASQNGDEACLKTLLAHKAHVNHAVTGHHGLTALYIAAKHGHSGCVRALLAHKAHVNHAGAGHNGFTALFIAAQNDHSGCVRALLAHKAHVNQEVLNGATPLHTASQNKHEACFQMLLAHKAHVNQEAHNGATPLHIAAKNGRSGCVRALLAHKAHVNHAINTGFTPLFIALHACHFHCVSILLERGAEATDALFFMGAKNRHKSFLRLLDYNILDSLSTKKWQEVSKQNLSLKVWKEAPHHILPYFSVNKIKAFLMKHPNKIREIYVSKIQELGCSEDTMPLIRALNPYIFTELPFSSFHFRAHTLTKYDNFIAYLKKTTQFEPNPKRKQISIAKTRRELIQRFHLTSFKHRNHNKLTILWRAIESLNFMIFSEINRSYQASKPIGTDGVPAIYLQSHLNLREMGRLRCTAKNIHIIMKNKQRPTDPTVQTIMRG